jgi:hypothetical protein
VQNYRKSSYDLKGKLNELPAKLDFSSGMPTFPYAYTSVFIVLALPGIFFAVLGVACCLPCWCMKTCGEITACCCKGKGICGTCNDFFCGCRSCPLPTGLCRWGPVGDYGTFFPFAKFERNTDLKDDEKSGCGLCAGTLIEPNEGESYHERDDFFSERRKPMERRCSIPNIVWLVIIVLCGALICAFSVWGSVQLGGMITGITGAIEEGNCVVEDGLDIVEELQKPLANISSIGENVAMAMDKIAKRGVPFSDEMKAITQRLTTLAAEINGDPCDFLSTTFTTAETQHSLDNTGARYPSAKMRDASQKTSAAASEASATQSGVDAIVSAATTIKGVAKMLNSTLKTAVTAASAAMGGPMLDLMKGTVRPINTQVSDYLGQVEEWQGRTTTALYVLIFIIVFAIIFTSIAWLVTTELYECAQKAGEKKINETLDVEMVEKQGDIIGEPEASGEMEDDESYVVAAAQPLDEEIEVEAVGTCGDCVCTIFQLTSIWSMHILHFIGWVIMMCTFIAAAFFSPLTVLVSDTCTIVNHVADHPIMWLNSPSSPVKNQSLVIDLVSACMDVTDGNMLKALGVADQLNQVSSMDIGSGTAIDVDALMVFSTITPMLDAINAMNNADLGWGVSQQIGNELLTQPQVDAVYQLNLDLNNETTGTLAADTSNFCTHANAYKKNFPACGGAVCEDMPGYGVNRGLKNFWGDNTYPQGELWAPKGNVPCSYCPQANWDGCSAYSGLTNAECYPPNTNVQCAPYAQGTAAPKRDALLALNVKHQCTNNLINSWEQEAQAISDDIANLKTRLSAFSTDLTTTIPASLMPINGNINRMVKLGSCSFLRTRLNGGLESVCGDFLGGLQAMSVNLTLIAVSFLVMLAVMSNCAIQRFRMYDVACWQHNATRGCSGAPEAEASSTVAPEPVAEF